MAYLSLILGLSYVITKKAVANIRGAQMSYEGMTAILVGMVFVSFSIIFVSIYVYYANQYLKSYKIGGIKKIIWFCTLEFISLTFIVITFLKVSGNLGRELVGTFILIFVIVSIVDNSWTKTNMK